MLRKWLEGGTELYSRGGRRLAAVPAISFLPLARGKPPGQVAVQGALMQILAIF